MLNLTYAHITALVIASVFLIFICIILAVHIRQESSRTATEPDVITKYIRKREHLLKTTGSKMKVELYLSMVLALPLIIGFVLYFMSNNAMMSIVAAALSCFIPRLIVEMAAKRHKRNFEDRYSRSLKQMASSLNAGMTITQAVDDVAKCRYINEQLRTEYAAMSSSLKMGTSVPTAFSDFAKSVVNDDAEDVAIAVDIQNEIGGREAETIMEIANNIHNRIMLRKEIKSIFGGTSSMIYIMDFIAPVAMIYFAMTNEDLINMYFSSPAYTLLFFVLIICPFIGIIITRKMLKSVTKEV